MVRAAQRYRKFVADLAIERTRLREAQMMSIGWPATTNNTGLLNNVPHMIAVTDTTRFGEGKNALIDICYPAGVFD